MDRALSILIIASPVAPLGSGQAGGVEHTAQVLTEGLSKKNHSVTIVAPMGSKVVGNVSLIEIDGPLENPVQLLGRKGLSPIHPKGVLSRSWEYAELHKYGLDVVLNLSYSWLSFYLSPFLQVPIAHLITKPSLLDSIDKAMMHTARRFPGSIGFHTSSQAATFANLPSPKILGGGIEVTQYPFNPEGENVVGWVGRIAPEKGLEDAVQAASLLNLSLRVIGKLEDSDYWRYIIERYPDASVQYLGFLTEGKLKEEVGKLGALLLTHRWVEPIGTVAMEALACGVPVISYRRGGPAEFVEDGKTGFLVTPDDISALAEAVRKVRSLSRRDCRLAAERAFASDAFCARVQSWLYDVIESRKEFDSLDSGREENTSFPQRRG